MFLVRSKRFILGSFILGVVYALITVLSSNYAAGPSLALTSFEFILSPISIGMLLTPILVFSLYAYIVLPVYFSSDFEWWLIRQKKGKVKSVATLIICLSTFFFIVGYPLAWVLLKLRLSGYRTYPVKDGIVNWVGLPASIAILFTVAILSVIMMNLLSLLVMLFVKRRWQVILGSLFIYLVLPIILIGPFILPESWMPIKVANLLLWKSDPNIQDLLFVYKYFIGSIVIEIILITLTIFYKSKRGGIR